MSLFPKSKLTEEQIAQLTYDDAKQALRVSGDLTTTVNFPDDQQVEISAQDGDSIIIAGTTDGTLTGPIKAIRTLADGTVVVSAGASFSTFTEVNPSDFRATTVTVTSTPTAISFGAFTLTSVSLYALPNNQTSIRVGKNDVSLNYFILTPGSSISLPLQASVTPVYYMLDSTGDAQLSIVAMGN